MNQSIYPIGGSERELPFYVFGIGFNDWQFDIVRKEGYPHNQIIYCTRGKGRVILDGKEYIITPNMCFSLPSKYPHEYYTIGDLWETHWIAFDGFASKVVLSQLDLDTAKVLSLQSVDSLEDIFQRMYHTMKKDRIYGDFTASGMLYSFLLELYRLSSSETDELSETKNSAIVSVLNYIDRHFFEDIQLEQLSNIAGVTPQHLCRLFRKRLNMRPVEYIEKKRIQSAKSLLLTTNKSISEIAECVGYNDVSYFGLTFRKYENMSPSDYRKFCG